MKKNNKFSIFLKVIKKRIKLSTLLMLIITFSSSTFAWFVYATKVESGITAHVRAWNVSFEVGDEEIVETINFNVTDIYPGMTTYTDSVQVTNAGETAASLSYDISSYTILGTKYEVDSAGTLTSDSLKQSLLNDYPFKISVSLSNYTISPGGVENFTINVVWPFDSGDDEADTLWGNRAYTYHNDNPDMPSISIELKISAVQSNG